MAEAQPAAPLAVREALAAMQRAVRQGEIEEARRIGAAAAVPLSVPPATLELGAELSRGAEAVVLRGRYGGRDVAVKRFTIARSDDLSRFRSELALMCELSHPAICPVLAAHALPPGYLLVMPLAAGTLHGRVHRQGWRPSWRELLGVGAALADALAAVHAAGVVHRDVKAANVLLTEDGAPLLSDFGLAAPADALLAESRITQAAVRSRGMPSGGFHKRMVLGTLEYMSPEVLLKAPSSFASDVYALAITINEAAAGTYPFSDCTKDNPDIHTVLEHGYGRQELAAAVAAEGLRPLLPAGGCPPGYQELISACWALDAAARPSAADVARRLAEIAGGLHEWEAARASAAAAAAPRPAPGGADLFARPPSAGTALPPAAMAASASYLSLARAGSSGGADSDSGRSSWTGDDADEAMDVVTEPGSPTAYGSPDAEGAVALSAAAAAAAGGVQLGGALGRAAAASAPPAGMELVAGAFGAIGPRDSMEDRQLMRACLGGDAGVHLLGVFDGHRGHEAAAFAAAQLPRALQLAALRQRGGAAAPADAPVGREPAIGASAAAAALREAFVDVDAGFRAEWSSAQAGSGGSVLSVASAGAGTSSGLTFGGGGGGSSGGAPRGAAGRNPGCTALAAVIAGGRLLVANAGDCRAVLCRGGAALGLSRQHTAELEDERARVLAAGGSVSRRAGGWRVGAAALQVTRALGDFDLKGPIDGGVTAEPEVVEFELSEADQFLVLASDGVWDVMSDAEAVGLVRDTVKDPQLCAKRLVTEALSRGSNDNATAVVVFFRPVASLESVWTRASGAPAPAATPTFFGSRRPAPAPLAGGGAADEARDTY
ncbi:MAG: phosphatase 2C-like domain-containing protein [Monoraphidium minutum]|nr:MAG: phosphatase 2C-like domain-containing protein [Monoraphidium minutum]